MPTIHFIEFDGRKETTEVSSGTSVMQAALNAGVHGIEAACGGVCACATCHVHVDSAWRERLPAPSEMEHALLEFVTGYDAGSRLSCQLVMDDSLDGITVRLPEWQG